MKRNLTKSLIPLFIGALFGAGLFTSLNAGQEYRPVTGYAFWSKADVNLKLAYLTGYSDAEQFYRLALDEGAKPLCTDAGKAWIEDFDRKVPTPNNVTFKQLIEGMDEFYRDWKNRAINLYLTRSIVRLQLTGRPRAEIEEATRKARAASNE